MNPPSPPDRASTGVAATALAAPVDQAARHDIAHAHDETLFVEAGAGTGKTTSLVSRAVELVASGRHGIQELAIITFTEAAAAELAERVRDELERVAFGPSNPVRKPLERDRCEEALAGVDGATITTLHGFAHRLLGEHPLEAGLAPGFEVLDDVQATIDAGRRMRRDIDDLLADPRLERALTVAILFGLSVRRVEEIAAELHRNWDHLDGRSFESPAITTPDPAPLVAALDLALGYADVCLDDSDLLARHLDTISAWRDRLARVAASAAVDDLDLLEALAAAPTLANSHGKKPNWPDGAKATVCAHLGEAQDLLDAAVTALQLASLGPVLDALCRVTLRAADDRVREARLEFHDLLVLARRLLRTDATVRHALAVRYPALLLDELQDTDPIQMEMALLIAGSVEVDGLAPTLPPDAQAAPGAVFFVGDPKQSIYRFRRADMGMYLAARERFDAGLRHLTRNHRSVPGILEWVNAVFSPLFEESGEDVQAPYEALVASRSPLAGVDTPVVLLGEEVPKGAALDELRSDEAREIAALVARVKGEGWPVQAPTDADPAAARAAQYADIALLLPSRTTLPFLEDAFERSGIPMRIESQSLVLATAEVADLLAVLRALDDPTDEVAIAASLRSAGFGASDADLVAFCQAGGAFDYRRPPPDGLPSSHPVVVGLSALAELHRRRWWETVSETLERVVRERRLLELAVLHRRPRDHWRRIRFLVDMARAFVDQGGSSVRGFITWIEDQLDQGARAVEVIVPEPDDDAVRVLTVHGSKGLEFPVVVLTGLNVGYRHQPGCVLWGDDGLPEARVHAKGFATAGFEALRERDRRADRAEQHRLLYVAATRARDHLAVCLHRREGDGCAARWLAPHVETAPRQRLMSLSAAPGVAPTPRRPDRSGASPDGVLAARDAWREQRDALLARAGRPVSVAATTLAADEAKAEVATDGTTPGERADGAASTVPPRRRGRAGTSVGRAVHAVLQSIDLATGDGLRSAAAAQAAAEGIGAHEAEVRSLAESVLASPTVRGAVSSARYWREVPVAATLDGPDGTPVLLEGFIDLLYETPDGLVIVDYKTDAARSDADLDAAMARYRLQGAAYALALERALSRPVARCVFVFARPRGAAVERTVNDLAAAVGRVAERVREGVG